LGIRHHQCHAKQAWQYATTESKCDAAKRYRDFMRIGLELTNTGVKVGDAPRRWKLRDRVVLEVGNLSAGVEDIR
jgi:hypothetical protein